MSGRPVKGRRSGPQHGIVAVRPCAEEFRAGRDGPQIQSWRPRALLSSRAGCLGSARGLCGDDAIARKRRRVRVSHSQPGRAGTSAPRGKANCAEPDPESAIHDLFLPVENSYPPSFRIYELVLLNGLHHTGKKPDPFADHPTHRNRLSIVKSFPRNTEGFAVGNVELAHQRSPFRPSELDGSSGIHFGIFGCSRTPGALPLRNSIPSASSVT
jgi:hypothetical protein